LKEDIESVGAPLAQVNRYPDKTPAASEEEPGITYVTLIVGVRPTPAPSPRSTTTTTRVELPSWFGIWDFHIYEYVL
jgi:hypothetical protein